MSYSNYAFKISRNLRKTLYLDCWAENIKLNINAYCVKLCAKDYL